MSERPLDVIRLAHNAIREDLRRLEITATLPEAQTDSGRNSLGLRFAFLKAYLSAHDAAETAVLLSPPLTSEEAALPYLVAHRHVHATMEAFDTALLQGDMSLVARSAAAARAAVEVHLSMEDEHLLPLCQSRLGPEEELRTLGKIAERIPPDIAMRTVRWMPPLLMPVEREMLVRFYRANIPAGPLDSVLQAVRESLGSQAWEELRARIPELPS